MLAFLYGQSRIFFVMARDGLLPGALAKVDKRSGTPVRMTLATAVLIAALAGAAPLAEIASLANAGTLVAFIAVSAAMLVLRRRDPNARRPFRTPFAWPVGILSIGGCILLFLSLQTKTIVFFVCWNVVGLVCYFLWRRLRSAGAAAAEAA
jgi:APA family basic amino acid/polyamine antiporter